MPHRISAIASLTVVTASLTNVVHAQVNAEDVLPWRVKEVAYIALFV